MKKKSLLIFAFVLAFGVLPVNAADNISLQVNNSTASVDGKDVEMDASPVVVDGRVMLPVRFVSEHFGNSVNWDATTKTVSISKSENSSDEKTLNELKDKMAIREVFDKFSVLADQHKIDEQTRLFTDDGVWRILRGREVAGEFKGYDEIFATSDATMKNFKESSHFNGLQVITIKDDTHASAIGYSHVTLDNGENVSTSDVRYEDEYIKVNGEWKIAERNSNFLTWSN